MSDYAGKGPEGRKLLAVLHADMVGYTRLIGLDYAGTLARVRAIRNELIDPAIQRHGGNVFQTAGDSLLIVFDSIADAVSCAAYMQGEMPHFDGDHPRDRLIRFRMGIDFGDVIADGTDLHGNGVNIAARLQAWCPPGSICVSRAVRDHVRDRVSVDFEPLGPLALKNVSHPIEAFVVRPSPALEPRDAAIPSLSDATAAKPPRLSMVVLCQRRAVHGL